MKPFSLFFVFLSVGTLLFICIPMGTVQSTTIPPNGLITTDSTWTKANSPYILTGPVAVNQGVTLTIEPGVEVNLGEFYLQVNGTIRAVGSDLEKIQFDGHTVGFFNSIRHGYIIFSESSTSFDASSGSGCIMENVVLTGDLMINGASPKLNKDSLGEININMAGPISGGSPIISNSTITGGMGITDASPIITGCNISGSSGYFGIGRSQERNYNVIVIKGYSSPVIANNKIAEDERGAILFSNDGRYSYFDAVVFGNSISGSDMAGITVVGGPGTIIISNNDIYGFASEGGYFSNARGISILKGDPSQGKYSVNIERNLIRDLGVGLKLDSDATIQNNTVRNCITAIQANSESAVTYNNFEGYLHSVNLTSSSNLNAANNWWGTTDQTAISSTITDNKKDFNLGAVTFVPLLSAEFPQSLPNSNAPVPTLAPTQPPTSPTPNPTENPTSSQNPTSTPTQPGHQNPFSLDWYQTAIIAVLTGIFVLLIILIFVVHKRKPK